MSIRKRYVVIGMAVAAAVGKAVSKKTRARKTTPSAAGAPTQPAEQTLSPRERLSYTPTLYWRLPDKPRPRRQ